MARGAESWCVWEGFPFIFVFFVLCFGVCQLTVPSAIMPIKPFVFFELGL